MDWLYSLKLIRLFDFYLAAMFLIGTALRIRQYQTILGVVRSVPGRWPRLFALVRQHRNLFLTWKTLAPTILALGLSLTHTLLRRVILKGSEDLTIAELLDLWAAVPFVLASGIAMVGYDIYGYINITQVDRRELEKYFDQAEFWLRSWTAPVVRIFTLGYVNPRQMVHAEVRKSLEDASAVINSSLYWISIQVSLRILFGLTLWVSFALTLL